MYYVKGQGYVEREPLVRQNAMGEQTVLSSGVLRNGQGQLHAAYDDQRGVVGPLFQKWKRGEPLTNDQIRQLNWFLTQRGETGTTEQMMNSRMAKQTMGIPSVSALNYSTGGSSLKNPKKTLTGL